MECYEITFPGPVAALRRYDSFPPEIKLRKKSKKSGKVISCGWDSLNINHLDLILMNPQESLFISASCISLPGKSYSILTVILNNYTTI